MAYDVRRVVEPGMPEAFADDDAKLRRGSALLVVLRREVAAEQWPSLQGLKKAAADQRAGDVLAAGTGACLDGALAEGSDALKEIVPFLQCAKDRVTEAVV